MIIDVNELKSRLVELDAQRAAIESEIAVYRASMVDGIVAQITDHASLVEFVDILNRVAEQFGLRCVLRRPGGGRRRAEAETGNDGEDEISSADSDDPNF